VPEDDDEWRMFSFAIFWIFYNAVIKV